MIQQLELQRPAPSGEPPDYNIPLLASLGVILMGLIITGVCALDSSKFQLKVIDFEVKNGFYSY